MVVPAKAGTQVLSGATTFLPRRFAVPDVKQPWAYYPFECGAAIKASSMGEGNGRETAAHRGGGEGPAEGGALLRDRVRAAPRRRGDARLRGRRLPDRRRGAPRAPQLQGRARL